MTLTSAQLRYRHPGFGDLRLRGYKDYDPPIPQVHAGESLLAPRARSFTQPFTDMSNAYGEKFVAENWPEAVGSGRVQVLKYYPSNPPSLSIL